MYVHMQNILVRDHKDVSLRLFTYFSTSNGCGLAFNALMHFHIQDCLHDRMSQVIKKVDYT